MTFSSFLHRLHGPEKREDTGGPDDDQKLYSMLILNVQTMKFHLSTDGIPVSLFFYLSSHYDSYVEIQDILYAILEERVPNLDFLTPAP